MSLKYKFFDYQVFSGPAAQGNSLRVIPWNHRENSVVFSRLAFDSPAADTIFYWRQANHIEARWWSKAGPVQFCGHGAVGLHFHLGQEAHNTEIFDGRHWLRSGLNGVWVPQIKLERIEPSSRLVRSLPLQGRVKKIFRSKEPPALLIELSSTRELKEHPLMTESLLSLKKTECGVLILYTFTGYDELSFRYFSPWWGKLEDQATGSALRYLSSLPEIEEGVSFQARQLSKSGGLLGFQKKAGAVELSGEVTLSAQGECAIPNQ